MARVLVTRPEPGTARTAEKLRVLGHEPVLLPLTRIEPLIPQWPAGRFDAVLATSANAFQTATALPEVWHDLPIHVVGTRTAEAARAAGFVKIKQPARDVNALLAGLSGSCSRGSRMVYLCGKVRRPDLEKGLEARGHFTTPVETYDTLSVSYTTDKVSAALSAIPIDFIMVLSGEAASALAPVLRSSDLAHLFENAELLCISGRIAEGLEPLAPGRVRVAGTPDEDALLALLG